MDLFKDVLSRLIELERRMGKMESSNQLRQILLTDGSYNRILLDGINGKLKISLPTNDVLTATAANLIFSTDFGAPGEYYYPVNDHRWQSNATWTFAGPWNPTLNRYEPIPIALDASNFPQASFYYEVILGGPASVMSSAQLFNITDNVAVAGSRIDFTPVSGEDSNPLRSGALTLPQAQKYYATQLMRTGGSASDTPSCVVGRIVVKIK